MESWRMLTVWQYADSHHEILQGLVSSVPLDTNSCCFTACPGHWIPFLSVQAPVQIQKHHRKMTDPWLHRKSSAWKKLADHHVPKHWPAWFLPVKDEATFGFLRHATEHGALQCFQQCRSMNLFVLAAQICHGHKRFVQLYSKWKASRRNLLLN